MLNILSSWDETTDFQVAVFNGHFATGKTYISNILAQVLSSREIGGGAENAQVEFFLTEDSFLPAQDFYLKLEKVVASSSITQDDRVVMNKMKIIVFDDVPCWANTSGITRFLNRCLQ